MSRTSLLRANSTSVAVFKYCDVVLTMPAYLRGDVTKLQRNTGCARMLQICSATIVRKDVTKVQCDRDCARMLQNWSGTRGGLRR